MSFDFGGISVASKKQVLKLKRIESCVLSDRTQARGQNKIPYAILTDQYYSPAEVASIEKHLRSLGVTKYILLCPIIYDIKKEEVTAEQKDKIISFYINNASDFKSYIPRDAVIFASGPSIYSLLQENDINYTDVEQVEFVRTFFWFSKNLNRDGNWVFPLEPIAEVFADGVANGAVKSYRTALFGSQFKIAQTLEGKFTPPVYPELKKHFIEFEEEFYSVFYEPNKNRKNDLMCIDLETSGLDFNRDKIGCITISFDGIEGYYIPWDFVDKEKLDEIFANNRLLGHNLSFDTLFIKKSGEIRKEIEGYIIIEIDGKRYQIRNHQRVKTDKGEKEAYNLAEDDSILNLEDLKVYEVSE